MVPHATLYISLGVILGVIACMPLRRLYFVVVVCSSGLSPTPGMMKVMVRPSISESAFYG